jgi:hypothetical protein
MATEPLDPEFIDWDRAELIAEILRLREATPSPWRPMDTDPPLGAGGQVWVAYRNPHHPTGWNLRVQWTPVVSEHAVELAFWTGCIRPEVPHGD